VRGDCRECTSNADCGAVEICVDNECETSCRADADCDGGNRHCDAALEMCFECVTDDHCAGGENPFCIGHECEECRTDADCTDPENPMCRENQCQN
jgi:hypothetical protein